MTTHKQIMKQLAKNMENLDKRIMNLETEIAKLTQQGTTQAKFYIRKDKSKKTDEILETYYLLHPMRNGKRRKEYVGRNSVEIRKAKERMERYAARKILIESLDVLKSKNRRAKKIIKDVCALTNDGSLNTVFLMEEY